MICPLQTLPEFYMRGQCSRYVSAESDIVYDMSITRRSTIRDIIHQMGESGGFESINVTAGLNILDSMIRDGDCLTFISFVGATMSTGLRGVVRDMIRHGWFDTAITTCGALDHDIARHFAAYKKGSFMMNDADLVEQDIHRLGSVLVPMENYGPLIEEKMQSFLEAEYESGTRRMTTTDICDMIGRNTGESSFLYWAHKTDTRVVVPGIMDGAVGSQIWMFTQKHPDFVLDVAGDSETIASQVFKAKRSGALMIGGGISKHHTMWWNQYRGGLDYALYITTATEFDGSLSGAPVREAISWGKVTTVAKQATLHAEATAILPFIYAALLEDG